MGSVRTLNHRKSIRLALSACCVLGAATLVRPATAATLLPSSPLLHAPAAHTRDPLQFADEITRRLRRMGISFSRSRIPHPYDDGETC